MNKIVLIIKDGWGYRKSRQNNAISQAETLIDDSLRKKYPWTLLEASGKAVGLPDKYQGNSEVGHLTIGSGRIINQNLVRINESIKDKSFFKKKELINALKNCRKNKSFLHLIILLQREGVHAHIEHLFALLDFCQKNKFKNVLIHLITDGRDSSVNKGKEYLKQVIQKTKEVKIGEIVTISGRYYAMDRDKRWQRTKKAYQAIVQGQAKDSFTDPLAKISQCYKKKETDEFIVPSVKKNYQGIKDNDSVIFCNLRTDRPKQLTQSIIEKDFSHWKRERKNVFFVAMTEYYDSIKAEILFKEEKIKNTLGEVLSKNNKKQLRISETEKYPHVTFFFNGQEEKCFKKEKRIMIPSPRVSTYDKKPEMSIKKVVKEFKKEVKKNYDFVLINLANIDMVGHTGNREATVKAVEFVDQAVGEIVEAGLKEKFVFLITADHGNAEEQSGEKTTTHTLNPVPLIVVAPEMKFKLESGKGLKDLAPTVLKMMDIKKPKEMTGESVLIFS
jgi:2,3-bisphosphoglycerate-independent phosphoglycerate mutase